MSETADLTNALLVEIPRKFEGARCWRNNRIDALTVTGDGKRRYVKAGINGQADISGIFPVARWVVMEHGTKLSGISGLRLEVEVKTGRDKLSADQLGFKAMILTAGGIFVEARSVEQCLEDLGRWA